MSSFHADPPPRLVKEPTGIQYLTADRLGKGGFAICHRAEQYDKINPNGKVVALKIVRSKMEPQKLAQKFITELQLHSKLQHPNIVEFYRAFSYEQSTYVVLEICENGSLGDALKKRKFFTMPEIRRFLIQICGAVKYLHFRNIVHRDLKTGNIFLDSQMDVKVGDFGLAAVLVGKNDIGLRRTTMCGTPNYLAPEILEKTGKGHNEKVDLWAIGIIAYTLAVGKAPFHAAKREDIYKNLQTRSYEWPDLSQHPNNISRDLQDLVSLLLVDEDDRPCPDKIVSHSYFKMAFIPDSLDSNATLLAPTWPLPKPPSTQVMRRGYTDNWFALCQECGVGEYAPGRTFSVVGLLSNSIARDVEREIKAGRAPTVPMPLTMVYLPWIVVDKKKERAAMKVAANLSQISEESNSGTSLSTNNQTSRLAEITANDRMQQVKLNMSARDRAKTIGSCSKENLPPITQQETAVDDGKNAKVAATSLRRARSARVKAQPTSSYPAAIKSIKSVKSVDCMSRSTYASQSSKPTRINATSTASNLTKPEQDEPATIKLSSRLYTMTKSTNTLNNNQAQAQAQRMTQELSVRPSSSSDYPETTSDRPNQNQERPSQAPPLRSGRSRTTSREETNKQKGSTISSSSTVAETRSHTLIAQEITKPRMTAVVEEALEKLRQPSPDADSSFKYSDPATVLTRAKRLRNNLLLILGGKNQPIPNGRLPALPFVHKWVDYAKKRGIGYVLSDGTVGAVFNATQDAPVRHLVVRRDGLKYLQKIYRHRNNFSASDVPLEIYTTGSTEAIKPLELAPSQKKFDGLYWVKFARYMCSSVNSTNDPTCTQDYEEPEGVVVRYYQRLGDIGVWGFSNGCFQFNFPDHTKLVLTNDGRHCSFMCLSMGGLQHLQKYGNLPLEFVKAREALQGSIPSLLEVGREKAALAKANSLKLKLVFIAQLFTLWIEGGGLGCKVDGQQWPRWTGPQMEDLSHPNTDWVIVGRTGGGECVVNEAPPPPLPSTKTCLTAAS